MKIQAQSTSIEHYHKVIEGDFEASQNAKVFAQIKKYGLMSGGMISFNIELPTNDVGRSLNALNKQELIERSHKDKCQISGVKVWYWKLRKKPVEPEPGIQARMNF